MENEYQDLDEEILYFALFCTTSTEDEAKKIARTVVQERLAACVNIIKGVVSIFTWKGAVDETQECLLIIKTRVEMIRDLTARIKELHSYDVPEVIVIPITDGNPAYLDWIDEVTG